MPKRFTYFLLTAQAILTALHWLFYKLLLYFFPALQAHSLGLGIFMLLMSVSFLALALGIHYLNFVLIDILYSLSASWLVFSLYTFFALVLAWLLFLPIHEWQQGFGLSALAVGIGLTLYGLINARIIQVTELTVELPNLPKFWQDKTAIVAADLHFGKVLRLGSAKKAVKKINQQHPDIVFIPGDFYDGDNADFEALASPFKKIDAPLGMFFSSGNHELYAGYEACEHAIKNAGVRILEDEKVVIEGLQIAGLSYKGDTVTYQGETEDTLKEQLEKVGLNRSEPSVIMKHVPSRLQIVEESGASLQLSGHTHHGQVWPFRYLTKKIFKGYDYGLNKLGNLQVCTSSGVGTWGPPLRVFTKSEIVKITFQTKTVPR